MTAKHKPATALPWETAVNGEEPPQWDVCAANGGDMVADLMNMPDTGEQDAAYIVHAANAYPRLVEALRNLKEQVECMNAQQAFGRDYDEARALLRELGEAD